MSNVPLLLADAEPSVAPEGLGLVAAEKLAEGQRRQPVRHTRSERRQ